MAITTIWNWLSGVSAEEWTAAAAWVTALVAATAAAVALRQLGEARRLRSEQTEAALLQIEESRRLRREEAAPYVVVYGEPSAADSGFVDFVICNLGRTAATDVRLDIKPPLERLVVEHPLRIPEIIPVLVPGQEFRTLWDSSYARAGTDISKRHNVVVTFSDPQGSNATSLRYVLDWDVLFPGGVTIYGEHHVAKALREISSEVKKWRDGRALSVYVRDGDARDDRMRERLDAESSDDAPTR